MKLLAAHTLPPGPHEAVSDQQHHRAKQCDENEILHNINICKMPERLSLLLYVFASAYLN